MELLMTLSHLIIILPLCGRFCSYHYFVDEAHRNKNKHIKIKKRNKLKELAGETQVLTAEILTPEHKPYTPFSSWKERKNRKKTTENKKAYY